MIASDSIPGTESVPIFLIRQVAILVQCQTAGGLPVQNVVSLLYWQTPYLASYRINISKYRTRNIKPKYENIEPNIEISNYNSNTNWMKFWIKIRIKRENGNIELELKCRMEISNELSKFRITTKLNTEFRYYFNIYIKIWNTSSLYESLQFCDSVSLFRTWSSLSRGCFAVQVKRTVNFHWDNRMHSDEAISYSSSGKTTSIVDEQQPPRLLQCHFINYGRIFENCVCLCVLNYYYWIDAKGNILFLWGKFRICINTSVISHNVVDWRGSMV